MVDESSEEWGRSYESYKDYDDRDFIWRNSYMKILDYYLKIWKDLESLADKGPTNFKAYASYCVSKRHSSHFHKRRRNAR